MQILSEEQIRNAEYSANAKGLSYECMMENAGKGCADFIIDSFPYTEKITVLCGKGKNGGDGFVIARHLANAGKAVTVASLFDCASDELSEKNKARLPETVQKFIWQQDAPEILRRLKTSQLIVDAVFGIGFKGMLPEQVNSAYAAANKSKAIRLAVDVPGGLSVNAPLQENVFKADYTLSMLCMKREQVLAPFSQYCGEVSVIPIGFEPQNGETPVSLTLREVKNMLPKRFASSNKGSYGNALIIAGSENMPGAAVLCAMGALNSGVGLTKLAFPDKCSFGIMTKLNECVFLPLQKDNSDTLPKKPREMLKKALQDCSAAAIGCGLGQSSYARELLFQAIESCRSPLIIDADGINILATHKDLLKEAKCPVLLTPHPGEMARLTGSTAAHINKNRREIALEFARENNVWLLLKGSDTLVCSPDGRVYINPTGSSGLSRGGSGDLLTGIAVSLAAQGLQPFETLCAAAYIHGLAGDIAEKKYTPYASSVERTARCLPDAFLKITESK